MADERWQQGKQLFQEALNPEPEQRAALLANAYVQNPSLREEIDFLIVVKRSLAISSVNLIFWPAAINKNAAGQQRRRT